MSYCQRDIITIEDKNKKMFCFVSTMHSFYMLLNTKSTARDGGAFCISEKR